MNNAGKLAVTNAMPVGITQARDCEYVTYSSIASANGHRMSYTNTSDPEGSYEAYGTNTEDDYMIVIVAGAQASAAILQIEVAY